MQTPDEIRVAGLELRARIGVPEKEREHEQRLTVWLSIQPSNGFDSAGEDLDRTVNYSAVCRRVRALAAERPRRLIETLALEIAETILKEFACARVEVELRKYVLADTEYVAARLSRSRSPT